MPLFSKPKAVIWPKANSVEIYLDKKDNNTLTFDINLWEEKGIADLQPILVYLKQNRIDSCSVLIPDDVVSTKSFIYDSQISNIDKKEVISLVESSVPFKVDPDSIQYNLVSGENKTIIQAIIFDQKKVNILNNLNKNLSLLNLKINTTRPVSASIANVIKNYFKQEYFFLYPLSSTEYTLFLAKADSVYLTAIVKGPTLDIQKIINYSNLYFASPTKKIYTPNNKELELPASGNLEKTPYSESQIANEAKKASNLPLPVLGLFIEANIVPSISAPVDKIQNNPITNISSTPKMENKRNILPIIAVFIFTAALASVIIWYVLNRGNDTTIETPTETPSSEVTPAVEIIPTSAPTPTVADISKSIKIQVLNATDINGQAATAKAMLTDLGFTSVTVGNSKEKATENKVQLKPSLSTASAYFQSKLDGQFPATYTTDLKETGTYDAVFIIGTDLKTGAPAAAPTTKATATPSSALSD